MKQKALSELEQKVMDVIWECNECSVRYILLRFEKNHKLAYTTIATILQRLYDKGLVTRKHTKSGYIYSYKMSRKLYSRNIAQGFLRKFINSFGDTAVASFAESIEQLPKEKRKYLLKLLEENEKNK